MAEKEVHKTTAKKAVRRTTTKTVPARTTVRKTGEASAVRKAPTRVLEKPAQVASHPKTGTFKILSIGFILFAILLGVSALIGSTDKGQLDVSLLISERKQNATPEESEALKSVPTEQTQNNIPNGGLVGMGQAEPVAPAPVATTTATTSSSTDSAATSTPETEQTEEQTEPEVVPEGNEAPAP